MTDNREVSVYAKTILQSFFRNPDHSNYLILHVEETLRHDGFDIFGPESNLWDLFLLVVNTKTGVLKTMQYHWEDWFDTTENLGYAPEPIYEKILSYKKPKTKQLATTHEVLPLSTVP